jgi:acyl-CoA reductase-like NAD-dependent aldehyde dehydrogenase
MMWDEPTPEEKEDIIKRVAETIYKYDMDLVAILFLESIKPIASVGGQLARYMIAPFVPFIGERSMPYLATFQSKENLEKLIRELEERGKEEEIERRQREERKAREGDTRKKGWRRYLPF